VCDDSKEVLSGSSECEEDKVLILKMDPCKTLIGKGILYVIFYVLTA